MTPGLRRLFLVDLAAVPVARRPAELAALAGALHAEFPAFRPIQWIAVDEVAAVVVLADEGTPVGALDRLNGWGHGPLELASSREDAIDQLIRALHRAG